MGRDGRSEVAVAQGAGHFGPVPYHVGQKGINTMVEFSEGKLGDDGRTFTVKHVKTIKQSSIGNCPHFIFGPEHYRADESCRCNDPDHTELAEWGYVWDGDIWK